MASREEYRCLQIILKTKIERTYITRWNRGEKSLKTIHVHAHLWATRLDEVEQHGDNGAVRETILHKNQPEILRGYVYLDNLNGG